MDGGPTSPYDRSAIRPSQIKRILKMKSPNSAPGEDGLLYGILYKLPSLHHVLATLFTKMNESCLAPASWARSTVILAHKGGEADDPSQFRMIALTSCLGKIYHHLKAERMADFIFFSFFRRQCTPFINKIFKNKLPRDRRRAFQG